MGKDTIADLLTSIRNADMNKKGTVRVVSTNITENIVKILLREGFIESVRKHQESNRYFLVSTLRHQKRKTRKGIYSVSADLAYEFMSTIKEFLRFWAEWELLFFLPLEV